MFATLFAAAALVAPALATISMTAPIASTSWAAGSPQTINWIDSGVAPTLAAFGPSMVGVYVGNAIQQTLVQLIQASVDVGSTSSITFTPDATVGSNGGDYFIRFTSLGLKDSTNAMYPAEAFSAKFALTGMTGTFNATVQAQIDAAASASAGSTPAASAAASGASSAAPAKSSGAAAASGSAAATSASAGASKAATSASKSASGATASNTSAANGAAGIAARVGVVGTVVALASAMLF